jgi:hypothetical protein
MRFRQRSISFEAIQFTATNVPAILNMTSGRFVAHVSQFNPLVGDLAGGIRVTLNDWVCRSDDGLFFTLPDVHFRDRYEPEPTGLVKQLVEALTDPVQKGVVHPATTLIQWLQNDQLLEQVRGELEKTDAETLDLLLKRL